jgi:hypothetical protein
VLQKRRKAINLTQSYGAFSSASKRNDFNLVMLFWTFVLRVLPVLPHRRIVAPGRAVTDPPEQRLDEKSASLRLGPGPGPRGYRDGEPDRKRDRGASSTLNPAAGGDHVAPPRTQTRLNRDAAATPKRNDGASTPALS